MYIRTYVQYSSSAVLQVCTWTCVVAVCGPYMSSSDNHFTSNLQVFNFVSSYVHSYIPTSYGYTACIVKYNHAWIAMFCVAKM